MFGRRGAAWHGTEVSAGPESQTQPQLLPLVLDLEHIAKVSLEALDYPRRPVVPLTHCLAFSFGRCCRGFVDDLTVEKTRNVAGGLFQMSDDSREALRCSVCPARVSRSEMKVKGMASAAVVRGLSSDNDCCGPPRRRRYRNNRWWSTYRW